LTRRFCHVAPIAGRRRYRPERTDHRRGIIERDRTSKTLGKDFARLQPPLLGLAGERPRCRKSGYLFVPRRDGQQGLRGYRIVELIREGASFFCTLPPVRGVVGWGVRHLVEQLDPPGFVPQPSV
jgi:hypothetical protein